AQGQVRGADGAEAAGEAVTARRQPVRQPGRGPDRRFAEVRRGPEAQYGAGYAIAGSGGDDQQLVLFGLEGLGTHPGTHAGSLDFEPCAEALLADQPDGAGAAGFRLVEEMGTHVKSLRYSKAYALISRP